MLFRVQFVLLFFTEVKSIETLKLFDKQCLLDCASRESFDLLINLYQYISISPLELHRRPALDCNHFYRVQKTRWLIQQNVVFIRDRKNFEVLTVM